MSRRPKAPWTSRTSACTAATERTSTGNAEASGPADAERLRRSRRLSAERAASATRAPAPCSACAMPSPMPRLPPITSAARPSRRKEERSKDISGKVLRLRHPGGDAAAVPFGDYRSPSGGLPSSLGRRQRFRRPGGLELGRIGTVSQHPEVRAAERERDDLAGDPDVTEIQRCRSAAPAPARRPASVFQPDACAARASLAQSGGDLHRAAGIGSRPAARRRARTRGWGSVVINVTLGARATRLVTRTEETAARSGTSLRCAADRPVLSAPAASRWSP